MTLFIWSSKTGNSNLWSHDSGRVVSGREFDGGSWGWACYYLSVCQLCELVCLKKIHWAEYSRFVHLLGWCEISVKKLTYNHKKVQFTEKCLTLICKAYSLVSLLPLLSLLQPFHHLPQSNLIKVLVNYYAWSASSPQVLLPHRG